MKRLIGQRTSTLLAAMAVTAGAGLPAGTAGAQPAREYGATAGQAATGVAQAAPQPPRSARPGAGSPPARSRESNGAPVQPCTTVTVDPPMSLALGKSQVVRLDVPAARIILGGNPASRAGSPVEAPEPGTPGAARPGGPTPAATTKYDGVAQADITLLSPTELFFLGRRPGAMNVILQGNDGRCVVKDLIVTIDPSALQARLTDLLPDEKDIRVRGADEALVLTGSVSDTVKLDQIMSLATTFGDGKKVVNMLRVTAPQQVMLEVKIAEVSKTLLDRFGLDFSRVLRNGPQFSVFSGVFGGQPLGIGRVRPRPNRNGEFEVPETFPGADLINSTNGASRGVLDAETRDGIIRVLAEPNIMAISGQQASFLSGGKIFIPVAQTNNGIGTTITLEEKEFGVGLRFTPTVLDGRINLKFVSEVSELSQTGTPFTSVGGITAVLPSLSTRRVDTTVQLADGQSFAVAGLIRHNVTEALDKFPGLGETPVVGALFRSTEFQNDQTELMFVVTPRLVKPVVGPITLPTDNHVVPSRSDVILRGKGEGADPAPQRQPAPQPQPQPQQQLPQPQVPQQPQPQPRPQSELQLEPLQPQPVVQQAAGPAGGVLGLRVLRTTSD